MVKKLIVLALALAAFLITPYFLQPDFDYGARELRGAVEGTWRLDLTAGGETARYVLAIRQAGAATTSRSEHGVVRSAAACGNRSLIRPAGACMDLTEMPLDIAVLAGPPNVAKGQLYVVGTRFETAQLELTVGAHRLTAKVSPRGEVLSLVPPAETVVALVRVAP